MSLLSVQENHEKGPLEEVPDGGISTLVLNGNTYICWLIEGIKTKSVKKDHKLLDDLKNGAKSSYRVKAGEEICENETKGEWTNVTVTNTGARGWIPTKIIQSWS